MTLRSTSRRSVLVGATAATTLAACGRSDAGDESAPAATVSSGPATGTLEFWAGSPDGDTLPDFITDFKTANPDLTVNITTVPSDDFDTKLTAAIAAGNVPAMVMLYSQSQSSVLATGSFATVPDGVVDWDSFFAPTVEGAKVGTAYKAVPWYAYTQAIYYRKDIVDQLGLTPPTTWDENVTFLKALVSGGHPMPLGLSVNWDEYTAEMLRIYMAQNGGAMLSDDGSEWTLNSAENVEAVAYVGSLFTDGLTSPDGPLFLDTVPWLTSGQTIANPNGPWLPGWLDEANGDGWTAAHMGTYAHPAGPKGKASNLAGGSLAVLGDAKNPDAAWKLITFMSQPEVQVAWYQNFGNLPAVQSAWEDPSIADDELLSPIRDMMDFSVGTPNAGTWSQVAAIIGEQMERVARGQATAQEAMDEAQSQAEAIGTGN